MLSRFRCCAKDSSYSFSSRVRGGGSLELCRFLGPCVNSEDRSLGDETLLHFLWDPELKKKKAPPSQSPSFICHRELYLHYNIEKRALWRQNIWMTNEARRAREVRRDGNDVAGLTGQ